MACHPSVPDAKDSYWILGQHGGSIKDHVSKAAPNQNAEKRGIKNKVAHAFLLQRSITTACEPLHEVKTPEKACDIRDTIPAYAKLLIKLNQERAEMMNVKAEKHLARILHDGWRHAISVAPEPARQRISAASPKELLGLAAERSHPRVALTNAAFLGIDLA